MKRMAIFVMFAIIAAWLALPLAGMSAAEAHACCRTHGEHHCADAIPAAGEHAANSHCPHHAGFMLARTLATTASYFQLQARIHGSAVVLLTPSNTPFQVSIERIGRAPPVALV